MMLEPSHVMYMKIHIDVEVSSFTNSHKSNLRAGKDPWKADRVTLCKYLWEPVPTTTSSNTNLMYLLQHVELIPGISESASNWNRDSVIEILEASWQCNWCQHSATRRLCLQYGKLLLCFGSNGSRACRCGSHCPIGECICSTLKRDPDFTVQCRFAYEHPQLLDWHAWDDEDDDPDTTGGMSTPSDRIDAKDASTSSGTTSGLSCPQKRKHTSQLASTLTFRKGSDFWSMVDKWFLARMKPNQLGTPWTSPGWVK